METAYADGLMVQVHHPGQKLKGKQRYKRLYHYTSFDKFLKIFYGQKLKFGAAVNMNDIMEANRKLVSNSITQLPLLFALEDTIASYKQISFTMDFDSLIKGCMSNSLWYHYGDKRNGVCIEFDFDKLKSQMPKNTKHGIVSYKYLLQDSLILPSSVETIREVEIFVRKNRKEIFFTKTKEWKYENEYRIISQNEEFLHFNDAILAVYFTNNDSEYVRVVEEISKGKFPVKYINYYSESKQITPIDNHTKSMREKIEKIEGKYKNKKTWMQQAKEYYLLNKSNKDKSLLMKEFVN